MTVFSPRNNLKLKIFEFEVKKFGRQTETGHSNNNPRFINMRFLSSLLALLLASFAISQACENFCPSYLTPPSLICASDLRLYDDYCRAACSNSNNIQILSCNNLAPIECLQNCARSYATSQCQSICKTIAITTGTYNPEILMCGSDGALFNNLCNARCRDPSIYPLFDCKVLNIDQNQPYCNSKCQTLTSCKRACSGYPSSQICARDSIIYRNECELLCANATAADGFSINEVRSSENCQNYVKLRYGIIVGLKPKPRRNV